MSFLSRFFKPKPIDPTLYIGLGSKPFRLKPHAKCSACSGLLAGEPAFWFFNDTAWYVCDTCYCTVSMSLVAKNIYANTRDTRLLQHVSLDDLIALRQEEGHEKAT